MKRILIALALLASLQIAGAQDVNKAISSAKSGIESALKVTSNEKKNTKPAPWIKLGQAYYAAYTAPQGNAWVGASKQELQYVMANDKPVKAEQVELGGQSFTKETYPTREYYFDGAGSLVAISVTQPVVEDALGLSLDAYKKANALDNGKKAKEIKEGIQKIAQSYVQEAYNCYTLGDLEGASKYFEYAADASMTEPFNQVDTASLYNAGFLASAYGDNDRAQAFFEKSISYGYAGSDGEAYAKLAAIADSKGDKAAGKAYLEEGFTKFPASQSILVGLINYYVTSGEDSDQLFVLLDKAKANEPSNASLYYVEGNIRLKLEQEDKAIEAYEKCNEISPEYEFGFIGEGLLFYNKAVALSEKADNEYDQAKYEALIKDMNEALKNCIVPFEKAYEVTKDASIKVSVAEYLKSVCFRFRAEDPSYQEKYDMYKKFIDENAQ